MTAPLTPLLYFDDLPLTPLLYAADGPGATPADALDYWRERADWSPELGHAVAARLAHAPGLLTPTDYPRLARLIAHVHTAAADTPDARVVLTLARLYQAGQRPAEAEHAYRQALFADENWPSPLTRPMRGPALRELADLLERRQQSVAAKLMRKLHEAGQTLDDGADDALPGVRSVALELVLGGELDGAAWLYQGLRRRRFEVPGTLVHLARVALLRQRRAEARQAVAQACRYLRRSMPHDDIPAYVLCRVLWLRLLFALLAGRPHAALTERLQSELRRTPERMEWSIQPVLELVKGELATAHWQLLETLLTAMNAPAAAPDPATAALRLTAMT